MQRTNRRAYDRSDCIIVTCVIDRLHDSFFRIVGVMHQNVEHRGYRLQQKRARIPARSAIAHVESVRKRLRELGLHIRRDGAVVIDVFAAAQFSRLETGSGWSLKLLPGKPK